MKRTLTMGLACVMTAVLAACSSGPDHSTSSGPDHSTATSGSPVATGAKESGPQEAAGGPGKVATDGGSGGGKGSSGASASGSPAPARSRSVAAVAFGSPSAEVNRRFASSVRTLEGVYSSVAVRGASRPGQEIGGVAVFTFSADKSRNATFCGQILNQLVMTTSGSRTVRADRVGAQKVVVSGAPGVVLGWFSGVTAVVVLSESDLATAKAIAAAELARR